MATVNFWDGMDKATEITGADKMMIGKNATGEAQYIDIELANQFISVQGIEMKAVPPGALPAGPEGQTRKMELREAGTWTYGGNTFTNPEGYVTVLWWDGTTWSLGSSVALPTTSIDERLKQWILGESYTISSYTENINGISTAVIVWPDNTPGDITSIQYDTSGRMTQMTYQYNSSTVITKVLSVTYNNNQVQTSIN